MMDTSVNVVSNDDNQSSVSHSRPAQRELDGAGRKKNGRETHGLHRVKRSIREAQAAGMKLIDARTTAGRALYEQREAWITDRGGPEALSAQQLAILDSALRTKMLLDYCDSYLLQLGDKIVNRRHKRLVPIALQRSQLADTLLRQLIAIGLDRKARPVKRLHELLASNNTGGDGVS